MPRGCPEGKQMLDPRAVIKFQNNASPPGLKHEQMPD